MNSRQPLSERSFILSTQHIRPSPKAAYNFLAQGLRRNAIVKCFPFPLIAIVIARVFCYPSKFF